jgi:hypothetical protein
MKKRASVLRLLLLSVFFTAMLAGCSMGGNHLSPPGWIQGSWTDSSSIVWTFTGDDAIETTGAVTLDFGKLPGVEFSDSQTATTYAISMTQSGVTFTYSFAQVDSLHILYMGAIPLTKQ